MTLPLTLDRARTLGVSRYYTGKTCVRGHACDRLTANRTCVECNREDVLKRNNARYTSNQAFAEETKARQYNARAQKFGCEGVLEGNDLRLVRRRQNDLCVCSREPITEFDHKIALFKQGPNKLFNLQGLGPMCAKEKFSADHREWHATVGYAR
jgi:hypothetical protein